MAVLVTTVLSTALRAVGALAMAKLPTAMVCMTVMGLQPQPEPEPELEPEPEPELELELEPSSRRVVRSR